MSYHIVVTLTLMTSVALFVPQDIAAFIKKEFDKKYNATWHCIVGRNFGSYVTHETKHFIYFYLGQASPKKGYGHDRQHNTSQHSTA